MKHALPHWMSIVTSIIALAVALMCNQARAGVGTQFTYQGRLTQGGNNVNATADFVFTVFDVPAGGTPISDTFEVNQITISDGVFTVELDFGPGMFGSEARWLGVAVRVPAGSGAFTTLAPRQPILPTPVAQFALNVNGATITNLNASNISTGTLPSTVISGNYGGAVNFTNSGNLFGGAFNGSGAGLTSLNATNIVSGNLPAARLPLGGDWPLSSTLTLDSTTLAVDPANNRVGIGTTTPATLLHLHNPNPIMVLQDTFFTTRGSISFRNVSSTETGSLGYSTPSSPLFSVVNTQGSIALMHGGGVGIGTTTPSGDIDVRDSFGRYLRFAFGTATINRTLNGTLMNFSVNDVVQGSISVSGATVSYNGFMGSHYAWMEDGPSIDRGALVRMTGDNRRLNGGAESDVVYGIEPTARANDPACLGAYLGIMEPDKAVDLTNPHLIAAVGNGEMLVVDAGTGDIQPGDYLISADVAGCAMKDDADRFPVGYIVARAAGVVQWNQVQSDDAGVKRAKVSVLFESFIRNSGAQQLAKRVQALEAELESLKQMNVRLVQLQQLLENSSSTRLAQNAGGAE